MSYIKINWINDDTELNAENMNHIEDGIANAYNVVLLAVSDTAPSECSEGDKYFNTDSNKIYTATGTNTWGSTGEDPIEDILYVVFETQTSYTYDADNETLISVGGGGGGGIVVEPDEPTEDTKLIIEESDLDFQGLEIVNEYNTADNMTYSCAYINGTVLYENASGTSSNIELNGDISDYSFIEFIATNRDNTNEIFNSFKYDTSKTIYTLMGETVSSNSFNIFTKTYTKGTTTAGKTTLTSSTGRLYNGSSTSNYEVFQIIKVIGYK